MHQMHGKCFGCGLVGHTKKDRHHKHDLCTYCKCPGHRKGVCMNKFLRQPKSQKVAAVLEEKDSNAEVPEGGQTGGGEMGVTPTVCATLAQLLAQQSVLTKQITAWNKEDF